MHKICGFNVTAVLRLNTHFHLMLNKKMMTKTVLFCEQIQKSQ